ncbi:MAG: DUF3995 domain-containing protein [Ekhidna sp.]|uniref:DUF3995 domain-containing protein n=1 Tax=Ekhidna sp. TaxID=2608089 RepID=UPI0032EFB91F
MILGAILFSIFLVLSLLHISWALGNSWGFEASIPTKESGEPVLHPKKIDSLVVGIGLLLFGIFYLIKSGIIGFDLPGWVLSTVGWLIPIIFLMRSIGDFRYVGFFKKNQIHSVRKARFGILFSPLPGDKPTWYHAGIVITYHLMNPTKP